MRISPQIFVICSFWGVLLSMSIGTHASSPPGELQIASSRRKSADYALRKISEEKHKLADDMLELMAGMMALADIPDVEEENLQNGKDAASSNEEKNATRRNRRRREERRRREQQRNRRNRTNDRRRLRVRYRRRFDEDETPVPVPV